MEFDPDGELARTLRDRVADEFRAEAEDAEHDARLHALRNRSLGQVAYDAMAQGRHVACLVGTAAFRGLIVHARSDLAMVAPGAPRAEPRGFVLLNLGGPVVLHMGDVIAPGRSADPVMAGSFVAALRGLEIEPTPVRLFVPGTAVIEDTIVAVAPDHVCLEGGSSTWHVPLDVIGAVQADRSAT